MLRAGVVYEVRYDDDEAYFVAARFSERDPALALMNRLAAAYQAADKDGCHSLDSAWQVVDVPVDDTDAAFLFASDLFDVDGEGHASVNIDRLPLREI